MRSLIKQNKKKLRRIRGAFGPKMAQDKSLSGAKLVRGGQNFSRGGSCPLPPTSRAYGFIAFNTTLWMISSNTFRANDIPL